MTAWNAVWTKFNILVSRRYTSFSGDSEDAPCTINRHPDEMCNEDVHACIQQKRIQNGPISTPHANFLTCLGNKS